jgi:hypothetical protein
MFVANGRHPLRPTNVRCREVVTSSPVLWMGAEQTQMASAGRKETVGCKTAIGLGGQEPGSSELAVANPRTDRKRSGAADLDPLGL